MGQNRKKLARKNLTVRVSDEERVALGRAASVAGISPSAWVRRSIRRNAIHELKRKGHSIPFFESNGDAS